MSTSLFKRLAEASGQVPTPFVKGAAVARLMAIVKDGLNDVAAVLPHGVVQKHKNAQGDQNIFLEAYAHYGIFDVAFLCGAYSFGERECYCAAEVVFRHLHNLGAFIFHVSPSDSPGMMRLPEDMVVVQLKAQLKNLEEIARAFVDTIQPVLDDVPLPKWNAPIDKAAAAAMRGAYKSFMDKIRSKIAGDPLLSQTRPRLFQ